MNFLEKMCTGSGMEKDEMYQSSTFLSQQCPSFVTSFPNDVVDVLAPPVGECYECGSWLVSYHSCNVKLYTLRGVKVVPKITLCCQHCQLFYNYTCMHLNVLCTFVTACSPGHAEVEFALILHCMDRYSVSLLILERACPNSSNGIEGIFEVLWSCIWRVIL